MTNAHAFIAALALVLLCSADALAQAPLPTTEGINAAMQTVKTDCASGKLTELQCAFFAKVNDAMLRWVRLIDSGAYRGLSPDAQQTIVAFATAVRSVPALLVPPPTPGQIEVAKHGDAFIQRYSTAAVRTREKCAKEWPTDFTMRAHCEEHQKEAGQKLSQRAMTAGDRLTIRQECLKQWADDLLMLNHCEEQQLEALQKLGR